MVIEEPDAKAVLRLMMTDTAPQIEAVSEATEAVSEASWLPKPRDLNNISIK